MRRFFENWRSRRTGFRVTFGTPEGMKTLGHLRQMAQMDKRLAGDPIALARLALNDPVAVGELIGRQAVIGEIQEIMGMTEDEARKRDNRVVSDPLGEDR